MSLGDVAATTWMIGGDEFRAYRYGDCVYFACVTLSTLGLGDYVPKNTRVFSNAFTFIFVAGGLSWASVSLQYFRRADLSLMNCGDAAAATWIFRGDESRPRRGCDVDIPWRRVARLRYAQLWCYPQHECMLRRHFDSDHFSDTPNADISTMTRVPRDAGAASSSSSTSAN